MMKVKNIVSTILLPFAVSAVMLSSSVYAEEAKAPEAAPEAAAATAAAPAEAAAEKKKKESPMTVEGATTVDTEAAKKLFDEGVKFVDVRSDKDWAAGRIAGATHLELKKVYTQESLGEVVKPEDKVVIYCNGSTCLRSSKASAQAVEWGYKNVSYYRDGYPAWVEAGHPSEQ